MALNDGISTVSNSFVIGPDAPEGPLAGSTFVPHYYAAASLRALCFGGTAAADATKPDLGNIMTPAEVQNIDTKLDDGLARTGTLWATNQSPTNNCHTGDAYNLSNTGQVCWFHINDFF